MPEPFCLSQWKKRTKNKRFYFQCRLLSFGMFAQSTIIVQDLKTVCVIFFISSFFTILLLIRELTFAVFTALRSALIRIFDSVKNTQNLFGATGSSMMSLSFSSTHIRTAVATEMLLPWTRVERGINSSSPSSSTSSN